MAWSDAAQLRRPLGNWRASSVNFACNPSCRSGFSQVGLPQIVMSVNSYVVLMMEEEQPEGLSARKLVVETAKHNVLTAYNAKDGMDLLRRFPNVDIILVHARLLEQHPGLLGEVKSAAHGKPIILASPFASEHRPEANYVVDSHHPHQLVQLRGQNLAQS